MYHYRYEDVHEGDNPSDVAFDNMSIADKNLNLTFFISGAQGWMNANKDKSYSDLEKELRKRSFDTHLFAKKIQLPKDRKLYVPSRDNDTTEYKYECIYSCRPKKYALEEVLRHWKTYDENLEALKYAGCIGVKDIDSLKGDTNVKYFDDTEMTNLQLVCENKKRIIAEYKSPETVIAEINKTIKEKYGEYPIHRTVGTHGGPICVVTIGEKIVSNVGYIKNIDNKGNVTLKLVEIQ